MNQFLASYVNWLQTMLLQVSQQPTGEDGAATVRTGLLTTEEMRQLVTEVNTVIERWTEHGKPPATTAPIQPGGPTG